MSKLITSQEAADMLGVSRVTVGRMIERGDLAAYQLPSGAIRIDRFDVEALLTASRINNQAPAPERATP